METINMPAVSKAQQRLFGLVHAFQQGKVPHGKVSAKIKRIAKSISPEDAEKYARTSHKDLTKELRDILLSSTYVRDTINEIITSGAPDYVKGIQIDQYTALLLQMTMQSLHEQQLETFMQRPLQEMIGIAYKMRAG
jgi:hypothetical protein